MAAGLELSLPATEAAIAQARRAVEGLEALAGHPEARFVVRLLVSEIFTNAVKYGARDALIRLSLEVGDSSARAEVADRGDGFLADAVAMPDTDAESGRGLAFLDALAHRWGVDRNGETRVWFELDL
jgi:anti-sigma regulatory factor (Ser/Thr protein kinase)